MMRKSIVFMWCLLMAPVLKLQAVVDPNFYIYLCFGQSNMEGNAPWESVDEGNVDPRFQMLATTNFETPQRKMGEWYTASCPIVSPTGKLGLCDYFGRTMVAQLPPSVKVGVVAVAMGGSPIEMFDKDLYQQKMQEKDQNGNTPWHVTLANWHYGGNPYGRLIEMAKKAQQVGVIKGILLHQGCSNNGDPQWPDKVKKIYNDMLSDLNLAAEDVPLLVGETERAEMGGVCYGHNDVIARIHSTIPTAHVVSSVGIPGNGADGFHFSAAGYRTFGKRYAVKALRLLGLEMGKSATPSPLYVDGRYFRNDLGEVVNMHGFAQTYSPWFNEQGSKWTNFNVSACLSYNKGLIDDIMNGGWKMTFLRLHMDPYWSNNVPAGVYYVPENDIQYFDFNRFKTYLDQVFVPMAEYAIGKGLYVVMRPPGVCPEKICIGDAYHKYLKQVWEYVAQHPKLKNNGAVLFELANEPVGIVNSNGTTAGDKEMTQYMQEIVDVMRKHCNNILLIPGLGWQSQYAGFARFPVQGYNIGYAVHCYPGWYNSGHEGEVSIGYQEFKHGWDQQIGPIAKKAPVVVTEMDWGPKKYSPSHKDANGNEVFDTRCSFAFAYTGTDGGEGFGANFRRICDETGNVSWLLFTGAELLARYNDNAPDGNTFLTDPEACPRPCYRWYKYYESKEYRDLINSSDYAPSISEEAQQPLFSLTNEWFDPNIWEKGTFDESTGQLVTGQYGFGGWKYPEGADLSQWKYLVVELKQAQNCWTSFRLFDQNSYWSAPFKVSFNSNTRVVVDLQNMKAYKDDNNTQFDHDVDPSHIYIAGFWTLGGTPIYIKSVYLSDDGVNPTGIEHPAIAEEPSVVPVYNLQGRRVGWSNATSQLPRGLYIMGGRKVLLK